MGHSDAPSHLGPDVLQVRIINPESLEELRQKMLRATSVIGPMRTESLAALTKAFVPSNTLKQVWGNFGGINPVKVRMGLPEAKTLFPQASRLAEQFAHSWTRDVGKIVSPAADQILKDFAKFVRPPLEQFAAFGKTYESTFKKLLPSFERIAEALRRSMPSNWPERVGDADRIVDLMKRTGLPLAWVPRADIVEALVQAEDDDARFTILLEHRDEILEDIEGCLAEVDGVELRDERAAGERALAAFKDGHPEAAQALAAAAVTSAVEKQFGKKLAAVRKEYTDRDPMQASIFRFSLVATLVMFANQALALFEPHEDQIPARFNRHASLHRVSPIQYTEKNSLVGLMLVASLLRGFAALRARGVDTS